MFTRKVYKELLDWKNTSNGKCACLVEGARRVGKSTVCEFFASKEYKSYIKVDFAGATEELLDVFKDINNHDLFFRRLQLETEKTLYERNSCIIFDEVQLYPKARQAIKYLVKDGRYDYIETGSLISIKKNVKDILIPSEEIKIQMYPMDYEEFCWATGGNYELLKTCYESNVPLGEKTNQSLLRKFKIYMAVGGMPQAVEAYVNGDDFVKIDRVKRKIIELYKEDLMKIDPSGYTSAIYASIPAQLSLKKKRFVISRATGKRVIEKDNERIFNLIDSKTVIPCFNVTKPDVSLSQTKDIDCFKLYVSDVGLFTTMLFNSSNALHSDIYQRLLSNKLSLDEGYLYENAVAQAIWSRNCSVFFHCWKKKESIHSYEIDFVLNNQNKITPIEVKSAGIKNHESLDAFCKKYSYVIKDSYIISTKDVGKKEAIFLKPVYFTELLIDWIVNPKLPY